MMLIILGAIRRLFWLCVVAVLVVGVYWWFREDLRPYTDAVRERWEELRGRTAESSDRPGTSQALADRAWVKVDALRTGDADQASFTDLELQSLLEYRYPEVLPAFVDSPRITLEDDRVRLRVRIPVDRLPQVRDLGEITALLPDTTDLEVRGQLLPAEEGRVAFAVDDVSAHRIPLPRRLVPAALDLLGRKDEPGLRADAIVIPLPGGARAAYVRADSLVLLGRQDRTRD
jgi:hypothetical protein